MYEHQLHIAQNMLVIAVDTDLQPYHSCYEGWPWRMDWGGHDPASPVAEMHLGLQEPEKGLAT